MSRGVRKWSQNVEISLENDLRKIARVAARIDEFCSAQGVGPEIAFPVNLAVDELLTNTISYGYEDDERHRIEVVVRLEGDTLVVVIVDDSAPPFDPTEVREPDLDAPDRGTRGGRARTPARQTGRWTASNTGGGAAATS